MDISELVIGIIQIAYVVFFVGLGITTVILILTILYYVAKILSGMV